MKHSLRFLLVSILALAVGAVELGFDVAAAQQEEKPRPDRKKNKKHVKAILTDPPATPVPPAAAPAPEADDEATAAENEPGTATDAAASSAPDAGDAVDPDRPQSPAERPAAAPAAGLVTDDATRPDSTPFEESIQVTEVQLDAIVEDGGKVVTGLGPDDFVVTEQGRPVEVTSVRFYGATEQLEATGEGDLERADRYFILFFHDRSRDAPAVRPLLLEAGQQARRWVEQQRLPNDQVAVMNYDVRLKIQTDFTRDQDQIVEAISRAATGKNEPDRAAGRSKEPLRPMADSPSLLLNLPAGEDLARESRVFEKTLALLGRSAEGIVGRKNLVLFSVGFGDVDHSGIWTPDVRYYPALERNLNDGDVAIYSVDLFGGRRAGPAGPGISSSLVSIASDTAGLYYESFTSFQTPLKEIAKDTAGYYLLSYSSEYPRGTTGYREVEVDTREKKYEVRARKGYLFGDENQPLVFPDEEEDEEDSEPRAAPSTGS